LLVTVWRGGYNLGPADLVVVPLDGSEPWELIADGWDNVSLPGSAWSEAADAIVYSSTEDPHDEIWMIEVGGDHTTRRITLHDGESSADVWAVEVDGTGLEQITTDSGYEGAPSWSPDGTQIAFEASAGDPDGDRTVVRFIDVGGVFTAP